MRLSDLTVEVRDKTLARQGKIDPSLLVLEGTVVHCGVGDWRLMLPADHDLVPLLRTPGSGILVTGPQDVLWSGPMTSPALSISVDDPHGTVTISGVTDDVILADVLAWPTPSAAISAQGGHDTRTGVAETVMRSFVNANIGPAGQLARRGLLAQKLTLAPDLGRGITVTKSARFRVLADLLTEIATVAGLGWRVVQRGQVLVFEVYEIADRARFVRFDIANGTLSSQSIEQSPPEETHVIVAGQNELEARTLIERTTPESLAGMADWGRRRELFRDQRQTDDLLELQQAGDEILAATGFTATAVKALPSDDQTMLYGVDWREGDRVTVVVDGQEASSTVTAVSLSVGPGGVRVGADIGDTSGFDPTSATSRRVEDTAARVSQLERNAEAGVDTSTRVAAGMVAMMAGVTVPPGWLLCNGQAVSRVTYARLFTAIGTTYGAGNGSSTFNVPDMRGRGPVGIDTGQAEFNAAGKVGGAKTHTLTSNEMPSHTHIQNAHTHTQNPHTHTTRVDASVAFSAAGGNYSERVWSGGSAATGATTATNIAATATNQATGGGAAHNNLAPYMAINFFIAT